MVNSHLLCRLSYRGLQFYFLYKTLKNLLRQRPTLPRSHPRSTMGAGGLNCCVRNGNRCDPSAIATEKFIFILTSLNYYNILIVLVKILSVFSYLLPVYIVPSKMHTRIIS